MSRTVWKTVMCAAVIGLAATSVARADCETDLLKLEAAYKTPNLAAPAKVALDDAKPIAVAALKKDDDAACHKAIADGMTKAGIPLK